MIALLSLLLALAGTPGASKSMAVADTPPSTFGCGDRQLQVWFGDLEGESVAVVDVGEGPHTLKSMPWDSNLEQLRWSDGARTLTWGTGVNLMWMDGHTHLMCNGSHHHQHGGDGGPSAPPTRS